VSQQPSVDAGSVFGAPHLDGLLTISSKAIQARIRTGALLWVASAEFHCAGDSVSKLFVKLCDLYIKIGRSPTSLTIVVYCCIVVARMDFGWADGWPHAVRLSAMRTAHAGLWA